MFAVKFELACICFNFFTSNPESTRPENSSSPFDLISGLCAGGVDILNPVIYCFCFYHTHDLAGQVEISETAVNYLFKSGVT